jgi:hypothetical protein
MDELPSSFCLLIAQSSSVFSSIRIPHTIGIGAVRDGGTTDASPKREQSE